VRPSTGRSPGARFGRALAATATAVAAAGGGMVIAAAGASPALASGPPAPARSHTIVITAHPRTQAGIGTNDIQPCAVRQGATPASCGDQTISCAITTTAIRGPDSTDHIYAPADVNCSKPVASISMQQSMLQGGIPVVTYVGGSSSLRNAETNAQTTCQPGTWASGASAFITFPEGFVITGGQNPIHIAGPALTFAPGGCLSGGGGGGGGGCGVVRVPSHPGRPAGRQPNLVVC
jgi:hypothetical protein